MGEFEEKIKKELLKSGFPLQIYCRRCLLENDWDVLSASEYYISDSDVKRLLLPLPPIEIQIEFVDTDHGRNIKEIGQLDDPFHIVLSGYRRFGDHGADG